MSRRFLFTLMVTVLLPVTLITALIAVVPNNNQGKSVPKAVAGSNLVPTGTWSNLPNFATVLLNYSPNLNVPAPLKLRRAAAAAYPPNGKVYIIGARHRADGDDITSAWIWEYNPAAPVTPTQKSALIDNTPY